MSSKRLFVSRFTKSFALSLFLIFSGSAYAAGTDSTKVASGAKTAAAPVAGNIEQGKTLFEANCASCHAVHTVVVGPALKDVTKRRDLPWIKKWVKNPAAVIASGDAYAVKLAGEYKGAGVMSSFASLKETDVEAIMAYVTDESGKTPTTAGPTQTPGGGNGGGSGVSQSFVNAILIAFGVVLFLIVIVLALILSVLRKYMKTKDGEFNEDEKYLANQSFNLQPLIKSTGFKFVVAFLLFGLVGKTTLDNLMNIGMQQGYAPKQPIPFSHKLHAGKYKN